MKTKDKLVVGFVWGIIVFETTCFLTIMCPLLYQKVSPILIHKDFFKFCLIVPAFVLIVSTLFVSYYKATIYPAGSPSTYIVSFL